MYGALVEHQIGFLVCLFQIVDTVTHISDITKQLMDSSVYFFQI